MTNELSEEEFKDLTNGCNVLHLTESDFKFTSCHGSDLSENNNRRFLDLTDHKGFKVRALNEDAVIIAKAKLFSAKKHLEKLKIIDNSQNIAMYNHVWAELNTALNFMNQI